MRSHPGHVHAIRSVVSRLHADTPEDCKYQHGEGTLLGNLLDDDLPIGFDVYQLPSCPQAMSALQTDSTVSSSRRVRQQPAVAL